MYLVGIRTLSSSQPLSSQRVCPSSQNLGEGVHSPAGEGLGESQFRRLEKKLSILPTLWYTVSRLNLYCTAKNKRGSRAVPIHSLRLCTISPMFQVLSCFNFKNRLQHLGPKKGKDFLMWSVLPKTQRPVVTLRYSPCDDTPTAATVQL